MGKLHQTPPLPTVTALKQEIYEVAKVLRKKKRRCQFTPHLGNTQAYSFFVNETIYKNILQRVKVIVCIDFMMERNL